MHAVGAYQHVTCGRRPIVESCGDASGPLFVFGKGLAEERVILQSRQQGLAEDASINLAGDVPASLPVLEIETEARQLSRAVIEKHKRACLAGASSCRPDEIIIPPRQTGLQGLASRVVNRQAIPLTPDVAPGVALEHRHGGALCDQRVRETQPAQSSSNNDRAWSSHFLLPPITSLS